MFIFGCIYLDHTSWVYIWSHIVELVEPAAHVWTCLVLLGGLIVKSWIILAWLETRSESPFILDLECAEHKITQKNSINKNTKQELDPDEHLEHVPPPWNCPMARRRFLENMQLKMFKEKSNDPLHTKPSVLGVFIRILRPRSIH